MDPTLTTTEAHRVFGDLYRKSRPAELQEQVDAIVAETPDVFVRIRRIEDLDAGYKRKIEEKDTGGAPRKPARRAGGAGGGGGNAKAGGGGGSGGAKQSRPQPQKRETKPGFFARLFGGDLAFWGKKTETLVSSGLFSTNVKLSPAALRMFSELKEDAILETTKAFRAMAGFGWEIVEPARYNCIIAAYQCFNEFIKQNSALKKTENPEEWITASIRLQKYYAMLLQFPNYARIITEDFPETLKQREQSAPYAAAAKNSMQFLVSLDSRTPSLKNVILAFYALARKRTMTWEDVVRDLKLGRPALDEYRAPQQVMDIINRKISDLRSKYVQSRENLAEISRIKNEFLKTDANGRLKTDFLDQIVEDSVRRTYGEAHVNDANLATFKREPHRLLFAVLKDFDNACLSLLAGSVSVRGDGHQSQEVLVFKTGLFKKHIDLFNPVYRDIENFVKKYRDVTYSFTDFIAHAKKPSQDPIILSFHDIVRNTNRVFTLLAADLNTVLYNDRSAGEVERSSGSNDKLAKTRAIPIENLDIGARYIAYGNREIVSANRQNGKTVQKAIWEIVRNLYNYLYIFRDPELTRILSSGAALEKELGVIKEELTRLGAAAE